MTREKKYESSPISVKQCYPASGQASWGSELWAVAPNAASAPEGAIPSPPPLIFGPTVPQGGFRWKLAVCFCCTSPPAQSELFKHPPARETLQLERQNSQQSEGHKSACRNAAHDSSIFVTVLSDFNSYVLSPSMEVGTWKGLLASRKCGVNVI